MKRIKARYYRVLEKYPGENEWIYAKDFGWGSEVPRKMERPPPPSTETIALFQESWLIQKIESKFTHSNGFACLRADRLLQLESKGEYTVLVNSSYQCTLSPAHQCFYQPIVAQIFLDDYS